MPATPAGAQLSDLVAEAPSELPTTVLDSQGDVILCGEGAHLSLEQLAASVLGDEPTHLEIALQVATRVDVNWTPFPPESGRR